MAHGAARFGHGVADRRSVHSLTLPVCLAMRPTIHSGRALSTLPAGLRPVPCGNDGPRPH
eukprot:6076239-Prymnesium_polylepis.1